jgi:hypothetical protein
MLMSEFYQKIDPVKKRQNYESESESENENDSETETIGTLDTIETVELGPFKCINSNISSVSPEQRSILKSAIKYDIKLYDLLKNEKKDNLINKIVEHKYLTAYEKYHIISKYTTDDKSDKAKMLSMIKCILNIPIGIINSFELSNVNETLHHARNKMDSYIYGMNNVKEELLDFLVKTVTDADYKGTIIGLEGEPGVGKCLGKDTEVLLYNGTVKKVQDITTRDLLMGPDNTPRYVLNTVTGKEKMYKIVNLESNEFYRINKSHILVFTSHSLPKPETNTIKKSYHIIIEGFCVNNYKDNKEFHDRVVRRMPEKWVNIIDHSVYNSLRQLRIVGNMKWQSNRFKILNDFPSF